MEIILLKTIEYGVLGGMPMLEGRREFGKMEFSWIRIIEDI